MSKVIVVGGGPAGMMAALIASKENEVILIERNNELGKKLKLTGGGRCNITNNRDIEDFFDKVVNNKKFLYSSFYSFTNYDLLKYLRDNGLEYKIEEANDYKVYTQSDKATEVIDLLKKDLIKNNVKILFNKKLVDLIVKDNAIKGIKLENGETILSDKVIISTGGKSYAHTGSDGAVFDILKKYNHTITNMYPSLSPINIKEDFIKNMQGISIENAEISFKVKKKTISKIGDMIFTHFGISGPCVLIISSYLNKLIESQEIELSLDFLPYVSRDEISKKMRESSNKNVANNLKGLLPANFSKSVFENLNLYDKKASDLSKSEELSILEYIKNMKLTCTSLKGFKTSMVTSGGVSVREINSSTMESKIINNLYFSGEAIDVDAETGGYNLQIAFSTGYLAGISV